jgi:predicted acetyltransferase
MNIDIQPAKYEEKSILRNLIELYLYDASEFNGCDLDDHGLYGYPYLDHYWTDETRHPFLIRANRKLAGFVFVRQIIVAEGANYFAIAEFFVSRKYRRKGIGKQAAFWVFDQYPGSWRVSQENENLLAQGFWRDVIQQYTDGNFKEIQDKECGGPIQVFIS